MGIAAIFATLILIILYLIIIVSNEGRIAKKEEKKANIGISKLVVANVKLLAKVARYKCNNKKLKEINQDLMDEHIEYLVLKNGFQIMLKSTFMNLQDIQDVDNTEICEEEKNKHRNIIINKFKKEILEKLSELDSSDKRSSSQLVK